MSAAGAQQMLSRELIEIVRGASPADAAEPLSRHLQVTPAPHRATGSAELGACVGDRGAAGPGGGVLPAGLCDTDGPGDGEPAACPPVRRRRLFRRAAEGGAWRLHVPPGAILAVDIETTGLDPRVDDVTCACVYDAEGGVARSFVFMRDGPGAREEFLALLDAAPRLCAFNGVRFDLPFLARRWGLAPERVGAWVRKLVDPFEASKLALNRTFSLDRLLAANGLSGKTGSGLHAVTLAREGRWDELADYCMHDTRMTHAAVALPALLLPEARAWRGKGSI
jgi:hypothetical protein